jgi:hypothetical protein
MMLVALLLMQSATPAPAPVDDEIVVIGERLKGWTGKVSETIGIRSCRTTKSTGDQEIDAIGCRVLTDCFLPMRRKMVTAAKQAGRDPEKRKAAMAPINAEMSVCFKERRTALVAELLDRRAAARERGS